MIRKLREADRENVLEFLSEEASINLFIIGDIEAFGFNEEFQELWAEFSETRISGLLLKFYENFIPYYKDQNFDVSRFAEIIKNHPGKKMISGKESIVKKFKIALNNSVEKTMYFCELRNMNKLEQSDIEICEAKISDARQVYELLDEIEEFRLTDTNSVERIERVLGTRTGRIYYIKVGERFVSVAQTTAENKFSAMVVGVATLKDYRNKGYMSKCLSKLCKDVMSDGKTLCLFYDNPKAGSIYHRLGFETIDRWMMLIEK